MLTCRIACAFATWSCTSSFLCLSTQLTVYMRNLSSECQTILPWLVNLFDIEVPLVPFIVTRDHFLSLSLAVSRLSKYTSLHRSCCSDLVTTSTVQGLNPAEEKIFFFFSSQKFPDQSWGQLSLLYRGFMEGKKRSESKVDHLSSANTEVKIE